MRASRYLIMAGMGLTALSACVDGTDATGLGRPEAVTVHAAPVFALAPTESEIAALDLLRVTLRDARDSIVASQETVIDPSESQWAVDLTVELIPGRIANLYLETELSDTDGAVESVEWSGRTRSFDVEASFEPLALRQVDLYRGPLANLDLSGVALSQSTLRLVPGTSTSLSWGLQGDTTGTVMYFGTTDPSVATVDADGKIHTLGVGETNVVVYGGLVSDSLLLSVISVQLPSPTEIASTIAPPLGYAADPLFISTFSDPVGAEAMRASLAQLLAALDAADAVGAIDRYEDAKEAWQAYRDGPFGYTDGPQLGVIELTLILLAGELNAGMP